LALDFDSLEKMRRVLMAEFDNEMEYKKHELEQIEKRLKEAESLWKRLQKIWNESNLIHFNYTLAVFLV
jgi:hypothetical protein